MSLSGSAIGAPQPGVRHEQTARRSRHARRHRRRPRHRLRRPPRRPTTVPPPPVHPAAGALEALSRRLPPGGDRRAVRQGEGAPRLPAPPRPQDQPRRLPAAAHVVAEEVPGHHAREPGWTRWVRARPVRPGLPGHHPRPGQPHLRLDRLRPPGRRLQHPGAELRPHVLRLRPPPLRPDHRPRSCRPGSTGPAGTRRTAPTPARPGSSGTSAPSTPCGTWRASAGRSASGS